MLRRRMMAQKTVKYGVYIQDGAGKLWTADEWDDSAIPTGVAVITEDCQFLIDPYSDPEPNLPMARQIDTTDIGIPTQGSPSIDYDGYENTLGIVTVYGKDKTLAAGWCGSQFILNSGWGYLGSGGEWDAVMKNYVEVNNCFEALGRDPLIVVGASYWTSSLVGVYMSGSGYIPTFWRISISETGSISFRAVVGSNASNVYTVAFGYLPRI